MMSWLSDRPRTTVPPDAAPGTVLPADSFTRAGVRALAGYAHLFGAKSGKKDAALDLSARHRTVVANGFQRSANDMQRRCVPLDGRAHQP